ncbi:MAG: hypothetical protein WC505_05520 [Patescibacteria group bacterium]
MSPIQQTCLVAIEQITLLYEDKEEMRQEIRTLGFTIELKEKLIRHLDKEIERSNATIKDLKNKQASS